MLNNIPHIKKTGQKAILAQYVFLFRENSASFVAGKNSFANEIQIFEQVNGVSEIHK